jgi:hypothetical protein
LSLPPRALPAKAHTPQGTESFFEHAEFKTNARFFDGPIDYLRRNQAYDFQK